ncbi:DUF3159 domain-containing protein [Saccharopolyspora phatthalungensis]|uniref:DUF3159 domain-containing protein n=1 Tax=Saccharopolyspora phatthalungensis TaxID=664693 RepID=UPI000B04C737
MEIIPTKGRVPARVTTLADPGWGVRRGLGGADDAVLVPVPADLADATGWLAFAKIAMGTPLTALALLVVVWAFRRSTKRLTAPAGRRR